MSNQARAAIAVTAVAAIVLAFVLANESSDSDKPSTETPVSATEPTGGATVDTTPTATAPAPDPVQTITVRDGQPVGGVKKLAFNSGEQVRFRVKSDIDEEIHVHGYDLAKDVTAGGSVSFAFDASIEGIFEIELEHSGVEIASLEVTP